MLLIRARDHPLTTPPDRLSTQDEQLVNSAGALEGNARVRIRPQDRRQRGKGVYRAQTLPLFGDSQGRRVATLATLAKGSYQLEVRYVGTSRIQSRSTARTIAVR